MCCSHVQDVSGVGMEGVNSKGVKITDDWTEGTSEDHEKDGSDMEGWEDDGWGTFDTPSHSKDHSKTPAATTKPTHSLSSGADFFDNITTNTSSAEKTKDAFDLWPSGTGQHSHKAKVSSNLPSASSLFQSVPASNESDRKSEPAHGVADDGWGDWSEDTPIKKTSKVKVLITQCRTHKAHQQHYP